MTKLRLFYDKPMNTLYGPPVAMLAVLKMGFLEHLGFLEKLAHKLDLNQIVFAKTPTEMA